MPAATQPGLTAELTTVPAIALWVRSVLRRRWVATVTLGLFAGLSAGLIGASLQAARRADGAVERHRARSRSYDVIVQGCPAAVVDPQALSQEEGVRLCVNRHTTESMAQDILANRPDVESWTTAGFLMAGILDPTAKTGWGRGVQMMAMAKPDVGAIVSRQILLAGRWADQAATDEVMIGEGAAAAGNIHVGDTIRLASWSQAHIDIPTSSAGTPETAPIECRVVGILRGPGDLQRRPSGDLTGLFLPDGLYAGPGWTAAHGDDFATWGYGAAVRLRGGPSAVSEFGSSLAEGTPGWNINTGSVEDVDLPALRRGVDTERQGVLVFAMIAMVAAVVFVGLTLARQLRREQGDRAALAALGFTRSGLIIGSVVRSLFAALMAIGIAVIAIVGLSPLGPVGLARRLEYSHPIRFDWPVLEVVAVALALFFAAVAAAAVIAADRSDRPRVRQAASSLAAPLGPVPRVALAFTRGVSFRLAIAAGAAAVAVAVGAGTLVASFNRVVEQPARYGALWDVAIGEYSDPVQYQHGVDLIRSNPNVADAAAILTATDVTKIDGLDVLYLAVEPIVGSAPTVMETGQAPRAEDEVALGAETAKNLKKRIGDTVALTWQNFSGDALTKTLHVTGIAVVSEPVTNRASAGEGIVVSPDLAHTLIGDGGGNPVAQSIVIRFKPTADRQAATDSVVHDFPASAREAVPQIDLGNLERLRSVPWLIAALIGVLALASLIHALITLLQRHAGDLAVLAALGMTSRQRRRVGLTAGVFLVAATAAVGVPLGLVLGRSVWRIVALRVFIPSGPVMPLLPTMIPPLVALVVTVGVAAVATRWVTRRTPAAQLRTE